MVDSISAHSRNDRLLVLSSVYPSKAAPFYGLFIRERMRRVHAQLPMIVVSPKAWSPIDWVIRLRRPGFRPPTIAFEIDDGVEVYRPRYLSMPGFLKNLDGRFMALCCQRLIRRLRQRYNFVLVDAHFLYPDGFAAMQLARQLSSPLTVTIRGSKDQRLVDTSRRKDLHDVLTNAAKVFSVSEDLKSSVGVRVGTDSNRILVSGNGVDTDKFFVVNKSKAREKLGLDPQAKVLISVGGLVRLKGFHRVIDLLPKIRQSIPQIKYLIVGGATAQSDILSELKSQVNRLGLDDVVQFCGPQPPEALRWYYGASDLFVLATEFEGWANVLLEAMACGLPVVTTDVGGNRQVVPSDRYGTLCEFWDAQQFGDAIVQALGKEWSTQAILEHAQGHSWDRKIHTLVHELEKVAYQAA